MPRRSNRLVHPGGHDESGDDAQHRNRQDCGAEIEGIGHDIHGASSGESEDYLTVTDLLAGEDVPNVVGVR